MFKTILLLTIIMETKTIASPGNPRDLKVIPFCSHKGSTAMKNSGVDGHKNFSNWAPSKFVINDVEYNSNEQFMMAKKAELFDKDAIGLIMAFDYFPPNGIPDAKWDQQMKDIKGFGRKIKNFDGNVWDNECRRIVEEGIKAKFSQNPLMKQTLLDTGDTILAEAASYDKIWGIGIGSDDVERVQDPKQWLGTNFLGYGLMKIRSELRSEL